MKSIYRLVSDQARNAAASHCRSAPHGWIVTIEESKRTDGQNRIFHAITTDIAKSGQPWAGKPRDAGEWKVLLVSAHTTATGIGSEMIPGLEGEFVNIRESTALMSIKRGASLISYAIAYADMNGIKLNEPDLDYYRSLPR